jgi:hypothetical protein
LKFRVASCFSLLCWFIFCILVIFQACNVNFSFRAPGNRRLFFLKYALVIGNFAFEKLEILNSKLLNFALKLAIFCPIFASKIRFFGARPGLGGG